jgi:peptidoglycan/LPS O-acetylase OafA/YrhL
MAKAGIGPLRPAQETRMPLYRADIDGLRAVSILLVVGYHAQPWLFSGGFIGVDVFFVISGFLITRIILMELKAGTFSSTTFYSRRIRRIFPALTVMLVVTYVIGWLVLLPDEFSLLGKSITAGVAFISNLFQLTQAGYFSPDAAENPLVHLWSLGIEEQFYIFWPPALCLLFGLKRRWLWIATITTVSFCISLAIVLGYKEWSFYSPISRAWELLAGGILANRYAEFPEHQVSRSSQRDNLMATIGIVAILGAAFGLNKGTLFPGFYALLPVLGAILLIVSPESFVNKILLSNRPMVVIGLISYPLYLWHWPLLSYLAIIRHGVPNVLEIWVAVIVALALSWLTFRFVEIPLRRDRNAVPKMSLALIAIGIVGITTVVTSGVGFRFPPEIRDIALLPPQNNTGFLDKCFLEAPEAQFNSSCIEQGAKPLLFLWGDSTAAALVPGLKNARQAEAFRLAHFASPGCAPILTAGSNARCDEANDVVFGFIKSSHPEIVLLHAMWETKDLGKLAGTIEQLKVIGTPRIIILGPVPVWKRTLPHSLVNYYRIRHVVADRIASGVTGLQGDEQIQAFSKTANVEYISAWHALCNSDGCLTRAGPAANDVITSDIVHLSDAGSNFLVERIKGSLFPPR